MEKLTIGNKFNEMGIWYEQITQVIHQQLDHALVKAVDEEGKNPKFYHFLRRENDWRPFISCKILDEGLLYPYMDKVRW